MDISSLDFTILLSVERRFGGFLQKIYLSAENLGFSHLDY
jgi:hypothetical protein